MAGPPAGFQEALNRKYDIQQQDTNARNRLLGAQADAIPLTTASENQLRSAQAYQTNQQGEQVAPLAQSQIGEAQARGRLYGSQANLTGVEAGVQGLDLRNAGDVLGEHIGGSVFDQDQANQGIPPDHAGILHDHLMANRLGGGVVNGQSLPSGSFDQGDPDRNRRGQIGLFGGNGGGAGYEAGAAGLKKGSANVRAPMPKAAAGGNLQAIMQAVGAQGAPPPGNQPAGPLPFMGGTARVPGQGSGNVDKIPAMLAPHEAVLTHGAASALGRGKIAALNAAHPPTPTSSLPSKKKTPPLQRGMV